LISSEHDARAASLAQVDIQNAVPDYKIILVRPVTVNLGGLAKSFLESFGSTTFSIADLKQVETWDKDKIVQTVSPHFERLFGVLMAAPVSVSISNTAAVARYIRNQKPIIAK
jgi:hypothetical protein